MIVKCMVSEDYLSEPMVIHGKSSTEGTSLYIPEFKGPGKREHFVADTLLPMMVLGLRELGNICCRHKMFLNKIRNIFAYRKQNLCRQQMLRPRAKGETFVSASICPQRCVLVCQGLK